MGTPESTREPCPDRILDDIGGAFGMGAVGGSAFYFMRGIKNSPAGARLSGGLQSLRMNGPKKGGSFAVWGGLYSTFDCAMVYARQKEDPWNSIISGAVTGGFLSLRQGLRASARSAVVGGVLLALMEGVSIMMNKSSIVTPNEQFMQDAAASAPYGATTMGQLFGQPVPDTTSSSSSGSEAGSGSWFGSWFKKKETEDDSGSKTHILESFDAPPVPTYDFK
ncbi:PREDICTED: mitochondrial import inner membrane translocase subunit TIM17-1-like [Camelina sativa]|uniref:Mitochondrial import inner membrane translocase subunit TIM17-1-like n=1 Tax=Camelina sativa TaxID=90675 RepID=A0ABM0YBB6_CAMSA|nr:PREDICTED: mitochondrial import inner membrane translocase subunit TIM17-1-like [Camelina sativa]